MFEASVLAIKSVHEVYGATHTPLPLNIASYQGWTGIAEGAVPARTAEATAS